MRPLDDAGKNGWTVADFSVLMVAVDLGARLLRCLARLAWNPADWRRIVFSDESRFQQCPDDHQRRGWKRPGQHAGPAFTITRLTGPQTQLMVHGALF
ncbi:uncharacterized protein TNCV_3273141 [Trichonephila clavipes]|nr:uncharacterized protein TNCV_3273141 [Trichonephila clavipes]